MIFLTLKSKVSNYMNWVELCKFFYTQGGLCYAFPHFRKKLLYSRYEQREQSVDSLHNIQKTIVNNDTH